MSSFAIGGIILVVLWKFSPELPGYDKIVNYITNDINSDRVWLFPNSHYHQLIEYHPFLINPVLKVNERKILSSNAYHITNQNILTHSNLVKTFERIFEGSEYAISHLCCNGNGIMYGKEIKE